MAKRKPDNSYYTEKELEIHLLKSIRKHTKDELFKMASLASELSKSHLIPLEWRKKQSNHLLEFIIKNKELTKDEIIKKLPL